MQRKKRQKGFTLVELVLYMGLLAILLFIFLDIFLNIIDNHLSSQAIAGVAQDGRFLYTRLTYDIQRAQSITQPAALGDISNTLVLQIDGVSYTYTLENGNLVVNTATSSNLLNDYTTSVSNVQFQRIGNTNGKHTIQMTYTVTGRTRIASQTETQTIQTTAGLR